MPLVPTFAPTTDDTAGNDELKVTTVHDEKTDGLPLAPTFAPETNDAAGTDEVNAPTGGDEETDGLLLKPTFEPETIDAVSSDEVNTATIKSSDISSSTVCYALLYSGLCSCIIQKIYVQQELSFNDVADNTLVIYDKDSPLVDLEDVFVSCHSRLISPFFFI